MIFGILGVWRKLKCICILFGLYLLTRLFLHGNVEKRNNFGLDFYVLVVYTLLQVEYKNKNHLKTNKSQF